jgi:hypothetical protein
METGPPQTQPKALSEEWTIRTIPGRTPSARRSLVSESTVTGPFLDAAIACSSPVISLTVFSAGKNNKPAGNLSPTGLSTVLNRVIQLLSTASLAADRYSAADRFYLEGNRSLSYGPLQFISLLFDDLDREVTGDRTAHRLQPQICVQTGEHLQIYSP